MMNKKTFSLLVASLAILAVMSACGNNAETGNNNTENVSTVTENPASNATGNSAGNTEVSTTPDNNVSNAGENDNEEILIIIDQTEKPIEGNSFDFLVNKRPEGYMLSKMEWKSDNTSIINTTQEAIEHGGNGEDGFYISGNGQFMGFFYPDELKGQKGDVTFTFVNDAGKELTWKKTITLK